MMKMNQDLLLFFQEIIYFKKIKDGAYVINLDEYEDTATHWIALFCKKMRLFISVALVLNIFLKKLKNLLEIKTKTNIFRVKANNSIMCGYFSIGFIDLMLADKKLTDFTNLFFPYDFNKNDQIIFSYFKDA